MSSAYLEIGKIKECKQSASAVRVRIYSFNFFITTSQTQGRRVPKLKMMTSTSLISEMPAMSHKESLYSEDCDECLFTQVPPPEVLQDEDLWDE